MILFNSSCSNDSEKIFNHTKKEVEIYSITFHKFDAFTREMNRPLEYLVIKHEIGDSILCFDYYLGKVQTPGFRFKTKDGRFDFIQEKKDFNLALIDKIKVVVFDKKIELYKFTQLNPPMDGKATYIFNKSLGLLGIRYLSWNNGQIINKINSFVIKNEWKKKLIEVLG